MTADPLKSWLEQQTKAQLIQLIEAQSLNDGDFLNALQLQAAAGEPVKNMTQIKQAIHNAFWIEDFVDWREASSYAANVDPVLETLEELLNNGEAATVIELVEDALACWVEAINNIHDDGEMGMILDTLCELHLNACRNAEPDPIALAEKLFGTATTHHGWGIFDDAYSTYADLLGPTGKNRYRELVAAKWNPLPKIKPGQEEGAGYDANWLSQLMIEFAVEDADFDRELDIMQRDLSNAWAFLQIAERCEAEKLPAPALEWVETGLRHFKDDLRLQEKCAELYWQTERRDAAMQLWWTLFETRRTLANYQTLISHAGKIKQRAQWQEKALQSVRTHIAKNDKEHQYRRNVVDHSLLVDIFLWEGNPQQAWDEAQSGGCSESLWLQLCKIREQETPAEVFPIYMQLAEESVLCKNNAAYHKAIEYILKARDLAEQCDMSGLFSILLSKIRMQHKPKRNLMQYLNEAGL